MKKLNKILYIIVCVFDEDKKREKVVKKLKLFVILLVAVMAMPLFFGCGEETFETTPWASSEATVLDIVNKFDDSKAYLNKVGLPVKFSTVTTFNLSKRLDESGEEKVVKDETSLTLFYDSTQNLAEIVTKRYVDGQLTKEKTTLYDDSTDKKIYTTTISYTKDEETLEGKKTTTYRVDNLSQSATTFLDILSQIVSIPNKNALTSVNQKTFDNIDYYQLLSSSSSDSQGGLNLLNEELFSENSDLYNEPNLYQVFDKAHDYVLNFSCEYGVDSMSDYLSYFAFNYSVSDSNNSRPGERGVYLKVSSTTNLVDYGEKLESPKMVDDKDFYSVSTFVDTVKENNSYVYYRDSLQANYNLVKVYKKENGMFVSVVPYVDGALNSEGEKKYYFSYEGNMYSGYEIDLKEKTYESTTYKPTFLDFDYSKDYLSKDGDSYKYGTSEKYIKIKISNLTDEKIKFAVRAMETNEMYVSDYGVGLEDFAGYDFKDFTLVA